MVQPHVPSPRDPDGPHQPAPRRRVVVCGDDRLAHRLVSELVNRYPAEVTVIFPSRRRGDAARIAAIEGVRIVESDQLDKPTLLAAGVADADALVIAQQDDAGNIHTALQAQDLNPGLRLVIRMFNMRLGHGVRTMFRDCAVLSDASMAAPTFVAAALGEIVPTHIRVAGRTLFVARRADVAPSQILCGLADTSNAPGDPVLLPADQGRATIVLATTDGGRGADRADRAGGPGDVEEPVAENQVQRSGWRQLRSRVKRSPYVVLAMARALMSRRLWRGVLALLLLLLSGSAVLSAGRHLNPWQAVYVTVLTALGNGQVDAGSVYLQLANLLVVAAGVALIPFITAAVVETVVTTQWESFRALGYARHVIVVGLGNVGTRVIQQLHDIGLPVVAIDRRGDSRGAQVTRQLGIPFIVGDAGREETLRAANVQACRAVVALSTDDVVNLEAGLHARNLNPGVRVVLRLFDGEFAELVQQSFGPMISRSVSYVAAPAFAAAIFEREVIGTIPVQRRVLLVADVPVGPASTLDGATIADADEAGQVRVLALTRHGTGWREMVWSPVGSARLAAGDRMLLIATRLGLSQILAGTTEVGPLQDLGDHEVRGADTPSTRNLGS